MKNLSNNQTLAYIFYRMAQCYRYLGAEQRFRATAYQNASRTLSNMSEPISLLASDKQHLVALQGIGESIAEKIVEYLQTGRIATYDKLLHEVPTGLLEIMDIEGFGPATVRMLHEQLSIDNREELQEALLKGKLDGIKGLGATKLSQLRKALKLPEEKQRMSLDEAKRIGSTVLKHIQSIKGVEKATLAGSLRREQDTVGDIDIVVTARHNQWKRIARKITTMPIVKRVLAAGDTRVSTIVQPSDTQVDVRIVHPDEYGAALFYFTGSKAHNIALRTIAKKHGWKINEYGVFDNATGKRLAGESEEEIYHLFGLPFIAPPQRTGQHELDAAKPNA